MATAGQKHKNNFLPVSASYNVERRLFMVHPVHVYEILYSSVGVHTAASCMADRDWKIP